MINIPNLLTVLRVLLIPVFILLFYLPFSWSYLAASAVFSLAAITDWLDGYLARRWQQSTPFGAFLDPVADKLMVAVALVLLVEAHANLWLSLPAAIIIGREIVISALREWMAELGRVPRSLFPAWGNGKPRHKWWRWLFCWPIRRSLPCGLAWAMPCCWLPQG